MESVLDIFTGDEEEQYLLCEKCQTVVASICKLHLELEVIQMKIISLVESVRDGVRNSAIMCSSSVSTFLDAGLKHGVGIDYACGIEKEVDGEASSSSRGGGLEGMEEDERLIQVLCSFQKAVAECKPPTQVPYVLLERCFDFPRISAALSQNIGEIKNETFILMENPSSQLVKTEPEESLMEIGEADDHDIDFHTFIIKAEEDLAPPLPLQTGLQFEEKQTRQLRKRVQIEVSKPEPEVKKKRRGGRPKKGKLNLTLKPVKSRCSKPSKRQRPYIFYTCDTCPSLKVRSVYQLQFHLQQHETGEKRFHCDTCPNDLWISGKQLYDFHMDCHHRRKHGVTCEFCRKNIDLFLLKDHMTTCSKGLSTIKLFPCINCGFCTSVRDRWVDHLRKHNKTAKQICDICSQEFQSATKLLEHLFEAHQAIEKIKCPHPNCDMTFLDKFSLAPHKELHSPRFVCRHRHCKKGFETRSKLENHELRHISERPFKCDKCSKDYMTEHSLRHHMDVDHGSVKYKCELCDMEYRAPETLKEHMRLHTGDTVSCEVCGVKCTSNAKLRRHMFIHSASKNFVCDLCGKAFRARYGLAKHKKTHSTERPFKCEHCDKAFRLNCFLVEHLRSHTGERPYVCDICGAGFTQKHSLNFHKKKHAQEQEEKARQ